MSPQLRHPDVKALAQGLLDYSSTGRRPQPIDGTKVGGGSPNMDWLVGATNHLASPARFRAALVAALAAQEQRGLFSWYDNCEQGVGPPHTQLHLTVHGALLLDAARRGDSEILGYEQRLFSGIYAISLNLSNAHHQLLMPGARQEDLGPQCDALDASAGIVGGRLRVFPFNHLWRDNMVAWALLATLALKNDLFAEARSWTAAVAPRHWYRLRWPLTKQEFAGGYIATIDVPLADARQMGPIGSGGLGVSEIRVRDSGGWGWRSIDGRWHGDLDPAADLGELRATVRAAA